MLTASTTNIPRTQRVWLVTGIVAAMFVLAVTVTLIIQHRQIDPDDPLDTAELLAVRAQLHQSPRDEALMAQIRQLDLEVRRRHFKHLERTRLGAWMLLAGGIVMVASLARYFSRRKHDVLPLPKEGFENREAFEGRWSLRTLMVSAVVLLGGLGVIGFAVNRSALEMELAKLQQISSEETIKPPAWNGPDVSEYLANWPRFRGPRGDGVAPGTNAPIEWDVASGKNVLWKIPVPLGGFNSPVVWNNRIFLTGSDGRAREVFCFDANTGALLWRVPVRLITDEQAAGMDIPEMTGLAAPTVATDGRHVYAMFGTGELVAVDSSGRIVWSKNFGQPGNMYGHSSSLLTWRDRVIVQLDQGDEESNLSRLYALDLLTGRVMWQQRRPVGASWATAILIESAGREQIVVAGQPWLMGHDPETGRELWRVGEFGHDLAPSPVFAGGLVFAISVSEKIAAVRPDGSGDVTESHVAWEEGGSIPDITSPVSNGELVFLLVSYDGLTCHDAATGKVVWEHELDGEFQASPVIAGDRLYAISIEGEAIVMEAGRESREMGRGHFGERVFASPAFVGDRIFVRGETNLFCIGFDEGAGKEVAHER